MKPPFEQVSEYLDDRPDIDRYLSFRFEDSGYRVSDKFSRVRAAVSLATDIYEVVDHLEGEDETDLISFQALDFSTQKYIDAGVFEREGSKLNADTNYMRALLKIRRNLDLKEGEKEDSRDLNLEALVEDPDSLDFEYERSRRGETVIDDTEGEYELDEDDMESGGGPEWF